MKTDNRDSQNTGRSINASDGQVDNKFPESRMHKDSRKDAASKQESEDSDIEALAEDVNGSVSSRNTSTSPEDIAGVSDIDKGLRRANKD